MCNISVDDCIEAVCYNNGTCVDQHLTYNCVCNVSWQGKSCEYSAFICTEKYCNDTHVCVGLMFKTDTLCISEDIYVVKLNFAKPNDTDIGTFQDQLIDFIIKYGRLTRLFQSGTNRRKRELNTEDPQIFVVSAEETGDKFVFDMVVMDDEETPKTKEEVLRALSITCQEISKLSILLFFTRVSKGLPFFNDYSKILQSICSVFGNDASIKRMLYSQPIEENRQSQELTFTLEVYITFKG